MAMLNYQRVIKKLQNFTQTWSKSCLGITRTQWNHCQLPGWVIRENWCFLELVTPKTLYNFPPKNRAIWMYCVGSHFLWTPPNGCFLKLGASPIFIFYGHLQIHPWRTSACPVASSVAAWRWKAAASRDRWDPCLGRNLASRVSGRWAKNGGKSIDTCQGTRLPQNRWFISWKIHL